MKRSPGKIDLGYHSLLLTSDKDCFAGLEGWRIERLTGVWPIETGADWRVLGPPLTEVSWPESPPTVYSPGWLSHQAGPGSSAKHFLYRWEGNLTIISNFWQLICVYVTQLYWQKQKNLFLCYAIQYTLRCFLLLRCNLLLNCRSPIGQHSSCDTMLSSYLSAAFVALYWTSPSCLRAGLACVDQYFNTEYYNIRGDTGQGPTTTRTHTQTTKKLFTDLFDIYWGISKIRLS